jgi:hypothetical protein
MKPQKVNILGMELDEWKLDSSVAHFGVGSDWATLYDIQSSIKEKGHATMLLKEAKSYYQSQNKKVGGSVALNPIMRKIYKKLNIKEYKK